jgi:hypothetical protein
MRVEVEAKRRFGKSLSLATYSGSSQSEFARILGLRYLPLPVQYTINIQELNQSM